MDEQSVAYPAHPSTGEETSHGCIAGVVYIGHMVEGEDGEEVEDYITMPCKRCQQERRTHLERTTESRGNLQG